MVSKLESDSDDGFDPFASVSEDEETKASLKKAAENQKKPKKAPPTAKSIVLWEVKPWGPDTDLNALGKKIINEIKLDGLVWKEEFKLEPVAFGIKKIVIGAVVEDEKVSVDHVGELIEEFEDYVQSVDILAFNKL